MSKDKKKLILKNETTGEIRPMVRCGMSACNRVIRLGESISYNSNYDVYCDDCEDDCGFVQRATLDDDWISGDCGWEEVEGEICQGVCLNDTSVTDCYGDCGGKI